MKRNLTEDVIDSLEPKSRRYICMDKQVPWLGVRVSPAGRKSFVMVARFNNANPTRAALGKLTLEQAREKVRAWQRSLEQGVDPRRAKSSKFGDVAQDWFKHIKAQRTSGDAERIVRKRLKDWWSKPIASITKQDAIDAIRKVKDQGKLCAAHQLLAHMRRVFNYALDNNMLAHSPCDRLRARGLIGERGVRQRVLTDAELRALWRASQKCGAYGPLWRLLLVTGQRRSDVAGARWSEFDTAAKLWTIPAARFKMNRVHVVPLSQLALDVLEDVPRDDDGERLFHVNGFGKAKARLDKLMGSPEHFVVHDIRRTVRTRLTPLTTHETAEAVVGHSKTGLNKTYNLYQYLDEKREALDAWASRLSAIVASKTPN
jgi:integrase